jgi:hypothetical protein
MKYILSLLLLLFFFSANKSLSQTKIYSFAAHTNDEVYWKDTRYMCDISPLSYFTGYEYVYGDYDICETYSTLPKYPDKNYIAHWTIIDDMLYMYDVKNACAIFENDDDKLDNSFIEMFLKVKFSKDFLSETDKKNERLKNGVIPAIWFTDTLYIKRYPKEGENSWRDEYRLESFTRLIFDKGHLIDEELVRFIERRDKSFYPKKKIIIQKSNRKITCLTSSQSISAPFCIDRKNIKSVNDNYDRNNRRITITFKNEPEIIPLSEVYKGEDYKNCIYIIDNEVITSDPALFMIEKGIIYKIEAITPSQLKTGQNVTVVKIQTQPEKEDDLMIRLTGVTN